MDKYSHSKFPRDCRGGKVGPAWTSTATGHRACPPHFPVTVEAASFAPHEQVQQQTKPVPVIEHVTSSANGFIAPTPPVTFPTPCQQFPAYTMPTVTSGVSLDTTGSVHFPCPLLLWKPLPLVLLVHFLSWISLLRASTRSSTPLKKLCSRFFFLGEGLN